MARGRSSPALSALRKSMFMGPEKRSTAPKLSAASKTLTKGKAFTLKVKNAGKAKVKWASSNKKVATVSKAGKVTAKKKGTAKISAKVGGKTYKCKITVK